MTNYVSTKETKTLYKVIITINKVDLCDSVAYLSLERAKYLLGKLIELEGGDK